MEQNHSAIHVYNNNTLSSCEWKPDFCTKIFMKKFIDLQQPFDVMLVFIKRIHLGNSTVTEVQIRQQIQPYLDLVRIDLFVQHTQA